MNIDTEVEAFEVALVVVGSIFDMDAKINAVVSLRSEPSCGAGTRFLAIPRHGGKAHRSGAGVSKLRITRALGITFLDAANLKVFPERGVGLEISTGRDGQTRYSGSARGLSTLLVNASLKFGLSTFQSR